MAQLKIKFVVTDDEDKFITFEDECNSALLEEYFNRIALALGAIYGHGGPRALKIDPGNFKQKIQLIKAIRMLSHVGLKDAKLAAEASDGIIMVAESAEDAALAARYIEDNSGQEVTIVPIGLEAYTNMSGPAAAIVHEEVLRRCAVDQATVETKLKVH